MKIKKVKKMGMGYCSHCGRIRQLGYDDGSKKLCTKCVIPLISSGIKACYFLGVKPTNENIKRYS